MENLKTIKQEFQKIKEELGKAENALDWERAGKLKKEQEFYQTILSRNQELETIQKQMQEAEKILTTEKDPLLAALALEEKGILTKKEQRIKQELERLIKHSSGEQEEPDAIIVEIRAGAGGEEAALFSSNLFNMYIRYAEKQGWKTKILSQNQTGLHGYKEIAFAVSGKNVYSKLKYEGGVHRVQRIPATEKSGRIHTSTASVAVLPKPKKTQISVKPEELEMTTFKSSGPGGQYVNKRETAVRIKHLPTGIVVSSQTERSLLQNKENALAVLEAKILEKKQEEQKSKMGSARRGQVGQAKRAEKIRTYNFPQNRLTDHRIKKTWHNLESVMSGELDEIINESERI